jgi:hypothetical protein
MALLEPQTRTLAHPGGARQPAMPSSLRPLPPPPARAFQVLQTHRTPTQLSLFAPPVASHKASR